MNANRWLSVITLLIITTYTWGCSPAPTEEGFTVEELQATAEASILETIRAYPTETVPPLPTLYISNTPDPDATLTYTPTLRPTKTPTSTFPTPPTATALPQVFVSRDTNCRTGPSNHYDWKTLVRSGQSASIVGESNDRYYWVIENPNGEGTCWLLKAYTTLAAPLDRIPIFASPPTKTPTKTATPTAAPYARFQFNQVTSCQGQDVLVISVYNSARRPLTSWRARLFNLPGKMIQTTIEENQFAHKYDACILSINTLEFRMSGYMIIPFDPYSATDFFVEVEACTSDSGIRDCSYDAISFNVAYITATPTYTNTPTITPTPTFTKTPTATP